MATLFEKIIARQIPATIVYEDDETLAFRDIHPAAPVHILVVPKKPIENITAASAEDINLLGKCLLVCRTVAEMEGLTDYRVVTNNGAGVGQSVFHLHFHVLGGRSFMWPPG
ncbi:MAG: histidine triad nucleotide-binding protein [Myxococcales bacterium]|nr:histidine triad nucleotide-binding protein [Myxococcales bacterium]